MRDLKHIDNVLSAIREVWSLFPDMSFVQLIGSILLACRDDKGPYYLEDDKLIEYLMVLV